MKLDCSLTLASVTFLGNFFNFTLIRQEGDMMTMGPLAYMDPGTGSMLLQLILGGMAGLFVVVRLFWNRILDLIGIKTKKPASESESESNDQPTES